MKQGRPPSAADTELAAWVTDQGHPTTPRQIRTWRTRGWVAPAIVEPQGYARPTKTSNPPEAFDQALAVAKIRKGRRTSPQDISFALFARGYPIGIEAIRDALGAYLASLREELDGASGGEVDPSDAGEALAARMTEVSSQSKSGRFMLKKARGSGESPEAVLQSAMTVIVTGLLGGSVSDFNQTTFDGTNALAELSRVTGMSGFVDDQIEGVGSITHDHDELQADNVTVFEQFTLERIVEVAQQATLEQLVAGREAALALLRFMNAFARVNNMTGGPATSFGLSIAEKIDLDDEAVIVISLLMTLFLEWQPGVLEENLPMFRVEGSRNEAMVELLERTPKHLHQYFGINGEKQQASASEEDMAELRDVVNAFAQDYPEHFAAIHQPSPTPEVPTG